MFEKQLQHVALLTVLLLGVYWFYENAAFSGQLWGIKTSVWFWLAVIMPIAHQFYVVLLWRAELYHQQMTKWFGEKAFKIFKIFFTALFVARPITLILLGISNANSLDISPFIAYTLAALFTIAFIYTMYSVFRYFGIDRAYGEDHFNPVEYKNKPLVRKGMFRFSSNAMYKFAFLILWAIALAFVSEAALIVAAFSHVYIWVHYYCTELPDMKYIYDGKR